MIRIDVKISLNIILYAISLLFVLITTKVECHIGEPCNSVLKICLPISSHIYCDSNNICRCRKEYPVVVGHHSCLQPKRVAERCSHPEECTHTDINSYCTQTSYSSRCECKEGFVYDKNQYLCVTEPKSRKPSNAALMIPTAAGFLMACFSLLCCCALIWHNLCRKHDITNRTIQQISSQRTRRSRSQTDANLQSCLNRRNVTNIGLNEGQTNTHLPPYESVLILHDEPPPSYEDAIKDSQIASSSETNAQNKV